MTIRETVKQALTGTPGNKPVTLGAIVLSAPTVCINDHDISILIAGDVTQTQLKRALRDIPYVRRLADGRYIVKGRRVPPKAKSVVVPTRKIVIVNDIPDYELADHEKPITHQGEWY